MSADSDIRARLLALIDELQAEDRQSADARRPVELDQQSVGRLSRMDALQNQAMAVAQKARREAAVRRIRAALHRLDEGEYGYCTECGEQIAAARLSLDPAIPTCLSCARG